ncbi:aspartyl-tRNA(Asn)/glutamyl-tRNA(Gln) amidotransferase subunit A [Leucobacter luti]|uniref:Aspartyl-tRNA(Asn)/glutamyl-tRNA(Gln) amidotransferase subunit A n=1 Tax=Leucobacter luti TaxID=340320 RepID=A0A4R6S0Z3_9MICO|nr:amidase [Leucobacter luti]TDP93192.1 aspartyl-tRNA(Asn)/glutamyl-tRNA(Gln) amidotransferase subunit A [Leucobacter luti]
MTPSSPTPQPDLTATRDALAAGDIDAATLLTSVRERADRIDPALGSFLERFGASADAAAAEHDRARAAGEPLPPLSGVPLTVKAFLAARECPPSAQSHVLDPARRIGEDADAVASLRAAGAVLIGQSTMVEYAMGRPDPATGFPVPRNPWNLERWPGGSSSGTANGIAAGLALGGLGTDTTGSVRIPAAMCGLTGLKPTYGLVPIGGCLPAAPSIDVVGPLARSARDVRLLLSVIAPGFAQVREKTPRRIGVPEALLSAERGVAPETATAVREALTILGAEGYKIEPFELPEFDELIGLTMSLALTEVYAGHRDRLMTEWDSYGRSFRRIAAAGAALPPELRTATLHRIAELRAQLCERLDGWTAIATPTWPTGAAAYAASGGLPIEETNFTAAWSAVGFPSLSLPAGFDAAGMPVGLLLSGAPGTDDWLLDAGETLQRVDQTHLLAPDLGQASLPLPAPVPDPDGARDPGAVVPVSQHPEWLRELELPLRETELAVISTMGAALAKVFAPTP